MGLDELMTVWDHLPAGEAVARAWMTPDPVAHGTWHRRAVEEVGYLMPLLARALDRLLRDLDDKMPSTDWRLWDWPDGHRPADALRVDRLPKPRRPTY